MPSFLSKVFGRKKQDDKESSRRGRESDASLLDGKFEAVSPTISPTATSFIGTLNGKSSSARKAKDHVPPHLSLHLPGPKEESRTLGVVFEADPDARILLPESTIGERRLNPSETLVLVRACSQAIAARGLETLGIMHPHWYSASPDIQRRLISLFIQSLASKSPITTLSPTPSTTVSAFESEINFTRSPHDVAAVLRWGLRHLQLEGATFGKDDTWYSKFFDGEASSAYPPKAFSTYLVPQLPTAHLELLVVTLEILSSLAAHAEANSISGSKLSKVLGLWLLTSVRADDKDDWSTFYARWERAGRMLEHLFLSRIRDETVSHRMPTRLLELVQHYPYGKGSQLLPRPRFSTRLHDAVIVRVETELPTKSEKPRHHPLRLIAEAFTAESAIDNGEYSKLWDVIKNAGTNENDPSPGGYPGLGHIFADETIRFLSLVPYDNIVNSPVSPTFSPHPTRRRSFSLSDKDKPDLAAKQSNGAAKSSSASPGTNWAEFSSVGFSDTVPFSAPLGATLFDRDVEITVPRRSNKGPKTSPISSIIGRKSLDNPPPTRQVIKLEDAKISSKVTSASPIQLDEAFIDFWSDALLDPISSTWPAFIICKLKPTVPGLEISEKRVEWLVVEQYFKRPAPLGSLSAESQDPSRRPRAASPKPSQKSDVSGTFSSARKRFSLFKAPSRPSFDKVSSSRKKAGTSSRVGEMGEALTEVEEKKDTVKLKIPSPKLRKSVDVTKAAADVTKPSDEVVNSGPKVAGVNIAAVTTGAVLLAAGTANVDSNASKVSEPVASSSQDPAPAPTGAHPTAPVPTKDNGNVIGFTGVDLAAVTAGAVLIAAGASVAIESSGTSDSAISSSQAPTHPAVIQSAVAIPSSEPVKDEEDVINNEQSVVNEVSHEAIVANTPVEPTAKVPEISANDSIPLEDSKSEDEVAISEPNVVKSLAAVPDSVEMTANDSTNATDNLSAAPSLSPEPSPSSRTSPEIAHPSLEAQEAETQDTDPAEETVVKDHIQEHVSENARNNGDEAFSSAPLVVASATGTATSTEASQPTSPEPSVAITEADSHRDLASGTQTVLATDASFADEPSSNLGTSEEETNPLQTSDVEIISPSNDIPSEPLKSYDLTSDEIITRRESPHHDNNIHEGEEPVLTPEESVTLDTQVPPTTEAQHTNIISEMTVQPTTDDDVSARSPTPVARTPPPVVNDTQANKPHQEDDVILHDQLDTEEQPGLPSQEE